MSYTTNHRKAKYLRENLPKYEKHIGHKVKLYDGSWAKLIRVSAIDGNIRCWVEATGLGEPFPVPHWADEIRDCDCGNA